MISTVDPQARHGHKSSARGFDGYKGHVAVDPDSEIITDTEVSAGNLGDAAVATELIDDLLSEPGADLSEDTADEAAEGSTVYGDSAYGSGEFQDTLANNDIASRCKSQPPTAPAGRFAKDRFEVDLGTEYRDLPGRTERHHPGAAGKATASPTSAAPASSGPRSQPSSTARQA